MGFQFLKRRKERRWRESVGSTVRGSQYNLEQGPIDGHTLPRAQLQICTKSLLGKKQRTQEEKDTKLERLILDYSGKKEEAFTAVVSELSREAINRYLEHASRVHPKTLEGMESWSRAFVCAAQCRTDLFAKTNLRFAIAILLAAYPTSGVGSQRVDIEAVFNAWRDITPVHAVLFRYSRQLTKHIIRRVARDLASFREVFSKYTPSHEDVIAAMRYSRILSGVEADNQEIVTALDENLSAWRRWAVWDTQSPGLLIRINGPSSARFNELTSLEWPDFESEAHQVCSSMWRTLIRDGQLFSWLTSRGYTIGVGLLTGDPPETLTSFMKELLDTTATSIQKNSSALLEYFIARDNLDPQALQSWKTINFVLRPEVSALLLPRTTPLPNNADVLMIECLTTLSRNFNTAIRTLLVREIARLVVASLNALLARLDDRSITTTDWTQPANRLWKLRDAISDARWLHPFIGELLDPSQVSQSRSQTRERSLVALRRLQIEISSRDHILKETLTAYIRSYLKHGRYVAEETMELPMTLHNIWMFKPSQESCDLMLLIASLDAIDELTRVECIKQTQRFYSTDVSRLNRSLEKVIVGDTLEIVGLTNIIAALCEASESLCCWKNLLQTFIERLGICIWVQDEEFLALGITQYRNWIARLHSMLGGAFGRIGEVHEWLQGLRKFDEAVRALQKLPDSQDALMATMRGFDDPNKDRYMEMLRCLTSQKEGARKQLMQHAYLLLRSQDLTTVWQTVRCLDTVSNYGLEACQNLMNQYNEDRNVATVRMAIWIQTHEVASDREEALLILGRLLMLVTDADIANSLTFSAVALRSTREYYQQRLAKMVITAKELEQARTRMRSAEKEQVQTMMEDLGLEGGSGTAAFMADLPGELVNFVDQTADDQIELSFPLTDFDAVQRLALGLSENETLSVHLRIANDSAIDGFCVHVVDSNEDISSGGAHSFYGGKTQPVKSYCHGKAVPLGYVVSCVLWRLFQTRRDHTLGEIYQAVTVAAKTCGSRCMVCSPPGSARLHRPTVCTKQTCRRQLLSSDLSVRLNDLRTDARAVDLILSSIFSAAAISNLALLPDRPDNTSDPQRLMDLLNGLPATKEIAAGPDVAKRIRRHGARVELLLSWACNNYRGCLVTAQGRFRIPHLPNVHQFLLLNGSPELEARFARRYSGRSSVVLFHGTTLDRVYGILSQGLRIASGTPLQKHGAAQGPGVYTSTEPGTPWSYANVVSRMHGAFFNSRSDFANAGVVLGCDYAGGHASGVTVVADESMLMVRYIFIVPAGSAAPQARQVIGPMLSTFNYLRSTAARQSVGVFHQACCIQKEPDPLSRGRGSRGFLFRGQGWSLRRLGIEISAQPS